jgi:hypothetical protein
MNCLRWNLGEPERSKETVEEAEEVKRQDVAPVVGSARSRGVSGVMPVESRQAGALEGADGLL